MSNSIFFGTIDSDAIEQDIVSKYTAASGKTPNPGDPEFHINATIAYARTLNLEAIERAGKANLVRFATGANLDYLAEFIGLSRAEASPSVTTLQFTLVTGHGQVVIPAGTLVSTLDGTAVYSTDTDVTAAVGVNTVTVNATCTTDGVFSNGYATGTVVTIQHPQPYLVSATNTTLTAGGAEIETDEAFRARWSLALEALSVAGPSGKYAFYAYTASPTITSVSVLGPHDLINPQVMPGDVEIRVLTKTGIPTQTILDAVFIACDDETVRPMCDTVIVLPANEIQYSLNIGVVKFKDADATDLEDNVKALIKAYTDKQGSTIGNDVEEDGVIDAGMIKDVVKRLDLNGFTSIPVDKRSFATCTGITVTIIGTEEP